MSLYICLLYYIILFKNWIWLPGQIVTCVNILIITKINNQLARSFILSHIARLTSITFATIMLVYLHGVFFHFLRRFFCTFIGLLLILHVMMQFLKVKCYTYAFYSLRFMLFPRQQCQVACHVRSKKIGRPLFLVANYAPNPRKWYKKKGRIFLPFFLTLQNGINTSQPHYSTDYWVDQPSVQVQPTRTPGWSVGCCWPIWPLDHEPMEAQ